jgi:voltage-gated potassium channel
MRKRVYEVIEVAKLNDRASRIYDVFMILVILASLLPITFKNPGTVVSIIDKVTAGIFVIDYLLRLWTADLKLKKGVRSYIQYPFTPMAIIDLISILPSISVLNQMFRVFKILRLLRAIRVLRVFKVVRYSKNIMFIMNVFKKQKDSLLTVCALAVGYIIVSALLVFSIEPETFPTFFDAVYWATVSLTTVGYGDIYAVSTGGRIITMVSAVFGIAVVALPAGIVTAGYMSELEDEKKKDEEIQQENPHSEEEYLNVQGHQVHIVDIQTHRVSRTEVEDAKKHHVR